MKAYLLAAASLLVVCSATAQSDHPKAFVGIAGGASLPQGDFAGTDFEKDDQGYAESGSFFDITAGYRFANHIGGMVLLRGQSNDVDIEERAKPGMPLKPGTTITVESGSWSQTGVFVGLYGILPVGAEKKFALEIRGMVGSVNAASPKQSFTTNSSTGTYWVKFEKKETSDVGYLAGLSFRYNISPRFSLSVSGDYMTSKHEFEHVSFINSYGETGKESFSQKIETINIGLGLAYRFF